MFRLRAVSSELPVAQTGDGTMSLPKRAFFAPFSYSSLQSPVSCQMKEMASSICCLHREFHVSAHCQYSHMNGWRLIDCNLLACRFPNFHNLSPALSKQLAHTSNQNKTHTAHRLSSVRSCVAACVVWDDAQDAGIQKLCTAHVCFTSSGQSMDLHTIAETAAHTPQQVVVHPLDSQSKSVLRWLNSFGEHFFEKSAAQWWIVP
mmetsp:Transcript_58606/g.96747  ORF Transcript_58606/g.96747 Transcript_58606/m.96747 type:complete len:204 (-) Transcript_58606:80-691(-)